MTKNKDDLTNRLCPLYKKVLNCDRCHKNRYISQVRFHGLEYSQKNCIVLLMLNPGGGKKSNRNDDLWKPLRKRKISKQDYEKYIDNQIERIKKYWHKKFNYTISERGLNIDLKKDIALLNLYHCPTNNRYNKEMAKKCWETHTKKILKVLKPKIIVAMYPYDAFFFPEIKKMLPEVLLIKIYHYACRGETYTTYENQILPKLKKKLHKFMEIKNQRAITEFLQKNRYMEYKGWWNI